MNTHNCANCQDTGMVQSQCTLCGDSTYDHECNDTELPCRCVRGAAHELRNVLEAVLDQYVGAMGQVAEKNLWVREARDVLRRRTP